MRPPHACDRYLNIGAVCQKTEQSSIAASPHTPHGALAVACDTAIGLETSVRYGGDCGGRDVPRQEQAAARSLQARRSRGDGRHLSPLPRRRDRVPAQGLHLPQRPRPLLLQGHPGPSRPQVRRAGGLSPRLRGQGARTPTTASTRLRTGCWPSAAT